MLVYLESKKLAMFPGCCLARDEDGVAKIGVDVDMLESVDPPELNGWLRRSRCGAGDDAEKARSDRDVKWSTLNCSVWGAGEATELSAGPVQAE
jgi:hypothetical protein